MSKDNLAEEVTIKVEKWIERVIVALLNSLLIYLILLHFGLGNYIYLGIPLIAIVSGALPQILAPAMVLFISIQYLYQNFNTTIEGLLYGVIFIILVFLVPLIVEVKFNTVQGFITALAIFSIPLTPFLLLSGISEKKQSIINLVSSIPFIYLALKDINPNSIDITSPLIYSIISIALLFIASIIFGLRNCFSIVGIIPSIFGASLLLNTTYVPNLTVIIISIIALVINTIFISVELLYKNKVTREKVSFETENLREEIEDYLTQLGRIKLISEFEENVKDIVSQGQNNLIAAEKEIEECKDIKCISALNDKINNEISDIEKSINDVIFSTVVEYNNIVVKLKKVGILMDELQYPKDKFKLKEAGIDYIQRLILEINKNVGFALNQINTAVENLEKITGKKFNKFYIVDYRALGDIVPLFSDKQLMNELISCYNAEIQVVSVINMPGNEQKKLEISKRINDIHQDNFAIQDLNKLYETMKDLLSLIGEYTDYLINELEKIIKKGKLPSISSSLESCKTIKENLSEDSTLCDKMLFVMNLSAKLNDASDIIKNKEAIIALLEILEDNTELLTDKLYEEKCISLENIGINSKLSTYVSEWFNVKGTKTVIKGERICLP
ncbi:hypothetical protein [Acidianus sp. RZ1]|uniref:hypothetical protein n=1 Tax=Acidianus sp. RZ1 TaxID=1540082 RepID=UPI001490C1C1|nr:hypothetical protein [Acidianus sp. RZ1]NON62332.1 hypothetical protein [Acidianus sp. RZ1]